MKIRGEDYLEYVYFSQFRIPVEGFVFEGRCARPQLRNEAVAPPNQHITCGGLGRLWPRGFIPCQP